MNLRNAPEISRRQFLRGDALGRRAPLRPPWAVPAREFAALCDRCDDCIYSCPERVIRFGSSGYPELDFSERGCSLCGECLKACDGKALRGDPARDRPWDLIAGIADSCLADRGVVCRSCGEACDQGAIRFRLRVAGAAKPELDPALCTGCGSCVGVCPSGSIGVGAPAEPQSMASSAPIQLL